MIRFRRNNLFKFLIIVCFSFLGLKSLLRNDNQSLYKNKYPPISAKMHKNLEKISKIDLKIYESLYILDLSIARLNKLFSILMSKEKLYESLIKKLELISFTDFLHDKKNSLLYKNYQIESDFFLHSNDKSIKVNENFIKYLYNKTHTYSFDHPRKNILKSKINVNTLLFLYFFILLKNYIP